MDFLLEGNEGKPLSYYKEKVSNKKYDLDARPCQKPQPDSEAISETLKIVKETKAENREIIKLIDDINNNPETIKANLRINLNKKFKESLEKAKSKSTAQDEIYKLQQNYNTSYNQIDQFLSWLHDGLHGTQDEIFVEALRIFSDNGIDEALLYLERNKNRVSDNIDDLKKQRNESWDLYEEKIRNCSRNRLLQGKFFLMQLRYIEAETCYSESIQETHNWNEAHREMGLLKLMLGSYVEAEIHLKKALEFANSHHDIAEAKGLLSKSLLANDKIKQAIQYGKEHLDEIAILNGTESPEYGSALLNYSRLTRGNNTIESTEILLFKAEEIFAAQPSEGTEAKDVRIAVLHDIGELYIMKHEPANAIQTLKKGIHLAEEDTPPKTPHYGKLLSTLAKAYRCLPHYAHDEVESLITRAINFYKETQGERNPVVALLLLELADIYLAINHLENADHKIQEAIKIADELDNNQHYLWGYIFQRTGKYALESNRADDAIKDLHKALKIFGDHEKFGKMHEVYANTQIELAITYQANENLNKSISLLKDCINKYKMIYHGYSNRINEPIITLIKELIKDDRPNEAEKFTKQIFIDSPEAHNAYYDTKLELEARIQYSKKDYANAHQTLNKLVDRIKDVPTPPERVIGLQIFYMDVMTSIGNSDAALQKLQEVENNIKIIKQLTVETITLFYYAKANLFEQIQNYKEAEKAITELMVIHTTYFKIDSLIIAENNFLLSKIHYKTNNHEEALAALKKATPIFKKTYRKNHKKNTELNKLSQKLEAKK